MNTHVTLAAAVFAALVAPAVAQQDSRAFGQLEPGQTVVEISQDEPPADNRWQPVNVGERLNQAAKADAAPNIPAPGGFVSLEDLAARQAEADAASRRQARQLAESLRTVSNPQADSPEQIGERAPAEIDSVPAERSASYAPGPVETIPLDLPGTQPAQLATNRSIGTPPSLVTNPNEAGLGIDSESDSNQASGNNFVLGWFDQQSAAVQTMLALGLVILLIYSLAWVYRKIAANQGGVAGINSGKAPAGILEVLGRYPLGGKQSLVLLKFDQRILLLSQSSTSKGGSEMTTLCELDRPEDVASVLVKIRDAEGTSINKSFRAAMHKAELQGQVAVRQPEPAQAVEAKPRPIPNPAPQPDVLPGHHDPFAGMGGKPMNGARSKASPESDRAELWGEESANDPVAALRKRLDALRNQQAGTPSGTRRSGAKSTSTQEWIT